MPSSAVALLFLIPGERVAPLVFVEKGWTRVRGFGSNTGLLQSLALSINEEIRSRVTYSVVLPRLSPESIEAFILAQLDQAGLGHNVFSAEALALIVRSGEGLLRRTRNLCLSSLIEAVRDQTRLVDLTQVNRVLIQPHWRKEYDSPSL